MKKLHSILALLLLMVCSMNFIACSDDDEEGATSSIVGKWAFSDDPDAGYIFSNDGKMIFWEDDWQDIEGSYTLNGNKLVVVYVEDGESDRDELTIFKLTSTTLVLGGYDEGEYEEMELTKVN